MAKRAKGGPKLRFEAAEVWLLTELIGSLQLLLVAGGTDTDAADEGAGEDERTVGGTGADDPEGLEGIEGLDWPDTAPVQPPQDPALRRLLPDAYSEDPEAAAEFRRYTDAGLREGMLADSAVVGAMLDGIPAGGKLDPDDDQAQAWLRVVTHLRLVLASRLGIVTAADQDELDGVDEDDPRTATFAVYSWLGAVLSEVLDGMR
ncbi:MAG: hypothetical protein QOJ62_1964 [Actinomycetota bacterium]|nr:hypothetical protein [Actinomycetota bacterium]